MKIVKSKKIIKKKLFLIITLIFLQLSVVFGFSIESLIVYADEEKVEKIGEKVDDLTKEKKELEEGKKENEQKKIQVSNEIGEINNNISVIEGELKKTQSELSRIEDEIGVIEKDIEDRRNSLSAILRNIHQARAEVSLILIESTGGFGDFFTILDNLEQMEIGLFDEVEKIKERKEQFEEKKEEQEKVYEVQEDQKNTLEVEKTKKAYVLSQTQQEIRTQEATISQLEGKISQLKNQLSALLGESYDAQDIKDAAKYASKKTGVRRDFIMGMLVVESDLGRYTGGCTYKQVEDGAKAAYKNKKLSKRAYETFNRRKELFKTICKELDYDYKKMKVSCNPASYYGTGGAMGVAQFMPDTWLGYKSLVISHTGHNPPDPWNLTDGVMAMGLKLAKVPGVTSGDEKAECSAAKLYLSGTTSSSYNWYCDKVFYWADNYKKIL